MNTDFTYCRNHKCKSKKTCKRYISTWKLHVWMMSFSLDKDLCDFYIPKDK